MRDACDGRARGLVLSNKGCSEAKADVTCEQEERCSIHLYLWGSDMESVIVTGQKCLKSAARVDELVISHWSNDWRIQAITRVVRTTYILGVSRAIQKLSHRRTGSDVRFGESKPVWVNFRITDQSSRTRYIYFQNSICAGIVDELAQSLGRRME